MAFKPYCLLTLFLVVLFMSAVFPLPLIAPFIDPEALDALRSSKKMAEFVKHLGIPHEGLCHPGEDENMDEMFNEELHFGDLIMDEEELEEIIEEEKGDSNDVQNDFESGGSSPKQGSTKKARRPKTWPDGIIPYYISRDFNEEERQKIEEAIEDMNDQISTVEFRPVEKYDQNYVMIFSGRGCYSKLGMKGGQQPLSLQANKCLVRGTIQHELLHVLGFRHEQNRPDRDGYVEILYQNIPKNWQKDYKGYSPSQANFVGKYDYYSVLHYPLQAPGSRGKKLALRVLDDTVDLERIGSRKRMSEGDIQKAEELYGDDDGDDDDDF